MIKSKFYKLLLFFLLLSFIIVSLSYADTNIATLVRVIDGDTLEISLNGKKEKVRLIGVDTPEIHVLEKLYRDAARTNRDIKTLQDLGAQASAFTKSLLKRGKNIRLEYDWQKRDKYGRILAFVWLDDGRMLNETIICAGYGNAYTRYPFKQEYMDRFLACQRIAIEKGLGLWASAPSTQETPPNPPVPSEPDSPAIAEYEIRGNVRSKIYHLPGCSNYDDISMGNRVIFQTEEEAQKAGYRKARNCR